MNLESSSYPPSPFITAEFTFDLKLGSLSTSVTQIPSYLHQEKNFLAKV